MSVCRALAAAGAAAAVCTLGLGGAPGGVRTRAVDVSLDTVVKGEFTRIIMSGAAGAETYRLTGASPNR